MPLVPPDPPLSADGIVLRLVDDSDVGWITQACADPEITRYIPFIPDPYTEADARAFVRYAQEGWASGSHAPFVIAEAGDHAADGTGDRAGIGAIELHLKTSGREYLGGPFGIADLSIAPSLGFAPMLGVKLDAYPAIAAWLARVQARPSWKKIYG